MPDSGPIKILPYISELLLISGSICIGMSKYLHNVGSQESVSIFINIVLDAFVTSVIYSPPSLPPVKFCNNFFKLILHQFIVSLVKCMILTKYIKE